MMCLHPRETMTTALANGRAGCCMRAQNGGETAGVLTGVR